jgi:hypothetical protein
VGSLIFSRLPLPAVALAGVALLFCAPGGG